MMIQFLYGKLHPRCFFEASFQVMHNHLEDFRCQCQGLSLLWIAENVAAVDRSQIPFLTMASSTPANAGFISGTMFI